MSNLERWKIIDSRTGKRSTNASFPSREWAWQMITEWQGRHDRGGRPDITREMLLHMVPALEDTK